MWATHFIAMLAFSPGIPSGYNIALTFLSLIAAIVLTGFGLVVALAPALPGAAWLGGAIVGGGIAAMHYTGMAAFQVEGRLVWDTQLVIASIFLGAAIGAASLPTGLRGKALRWKILGALLLTIAICSHHFTAMGAVSIIPDPTIMVSTSALPVGWLAVAVALASFVIILLALAGLAVDIRDRRHAALESDRMRGLANAAMEGLLVCEGETIVTVNNGFAALTGYSVEQLIGAKLATCFLEEGTRMRLLGRPNQSVEAELRAADGAAIPIELVLRPVDFGGKAHHAIAVRDLRGRNEAERLRFLAHHDALTGLPNRSSFSNKLDVDIEAQVGTSQRLAVLCLDLDRFKEINDLFGHAAGDSMLRSVAKCVTEVLGADQMMARLGGDEFAIIAPGLTDASVAGGIAERILEALRASRESTAAGAFASASIGIAICPDDGVEAQALLSHADTALYRAKTDGRDTYCFFESVRERRQVEQDLRNAVARREFGLVYQPQQRIKGGEILGFEALLRWNHATRGEVSPDKFIRIAEECGAILPIGEWVLRTACCDAARWTRPLMVAVNVSAMQLHNPNFTQLVHEILFQSGLPSHRLELEITETALVRDLDRALSTLRQLKGLGVRIVMDDFGTGYSSLSNLRAFPFDKIKIDGSFVASVDLNRQTATIVRAVLGLGRGLGLPVLAEGVETPGELKFLADEGCDEAQGYFLGGPANIEQFRHVTDHGGQATEATNVIRLSHESGRRTAS